MTKFERALLAIKEADRALKTLENAQLKSIEQAIKNSLQKLDRELRTKWRGEGVDLLGRDRALLLAADLRETLNILRPNDPAVKALLKQLESTIKEASAIGNSAAQETAVGRLSAASSANISIDVAAAAARQAHDMLLNHGSQFASNASIAIQEGIMLGYGVSKTARMIKSLGEVTRSRAETIVRTETLRAATTATKERFARDDIDTVIWTATQDKRCCRRCSVKAGLVMPMDQATLPLHPNCRCALMPYRKAWDDLGLIDHGWLNNHHEATMREAKDK